ncbi:XRN 5'-3' exonuclease N-terminus-domain-containing protein [Melampsora americana]|nr:XRN 5'-3' exonuclease N-terminus-domain-containing protein [Melampsora americana]
MGVPALFRWLSKKYPKIVEQVIEDVPIRTEVEGGYEESPLDMSKRNPNGVEFDNLYLDMNGIVHPCTHPEGKKPPETEEEMMIEVFKYTERVVNMVRPRKLLMIAIDGVAPRAKMNQQRSRRFRAAQEAQTKEEAKLAAIEEWKAMGKELSDEFKSDKKAWDSNAITPGTPFMTLLTESLRYWIVHKMNTDPGWKQIQVILSDASVPGEGEHKIMDFIRRQRTHSSYDPNTSHVIYGLDADLIMLSLATHEPHFKVLREDVFADQKKGRGCYTCGQPGHHSSQCQGKPKEKVDEFDIKQKPVERKPFIFLDVTTLREYLAIELNLPGLPFPFDLERAIDDWVLLIFFVGNDFLPHLPSLEIREGAVDTLLKIWKSNLAKMGGYLTDCGKLNLERTEIILDGLAGREDEIFRKRREAEERQDRDTKKRKIESEQSGRSVPPSTGSYVQAPSNNPHVPGNRPGFLPPKPSSSHTTGIPGLNSSDPNSTISMMSNADVVKNRFAIRAANLDAAAMLKAQLSGQLEVSKTEAPDSQTVDHEPNSDMVESTEQNPMDTETAPLDADPLSPVRRSKRKADSLDEEDSALVTDEDAGNVSVALPSGPSKPAPLKMLGNNMVEQDDTVKLWEPGYRERYYRQKFGIELSDEIERRKIVQCYVEGLAWVLAYYYQGCQSWQWFYPYHYSPFAADFTNLKEMKVEFKLGQPFKPYEQLMGVFPAASRSHIPKAYHDLMTSESDEARNKMGEPVVFCSEGHPQYDQYCNMYRKRTMTEPMRLDPDTANGVFGSALPDSNCIPGSTFHSPLPEVGLPDISNDQSIFAKYIFPEQLVPHRSVLLNGVKVEKRILNNHDREMTRRGGNFHSGGGGGGGGGGGHGYGEGFHQQRRDYGGGPGIANGFVNQHQNSYHYNGSGQNPQYNYHRNAQAQSSGPHRGNYSSRGSSHSYSSAPTHQAQYDSGGYGANGQMQSNRGNGQMNWNRGNGHMNSNRGNGQMNPNRGHHHHHQTGPYLSQPPRLYAAPTYAGTTPTSYTSSSGYGGTGVGLPIRPNPPPGVSIGRGATTNGYRSQPIIPAVVRSNNHQYSSLPPSFGNSSSGHRPNRGRQ